jgi:hypothetical protein
VEESADEVPIPRHAPVRSCLVGGSAAAVLCPVAPDSLRAAMASPEAKEWKAAMDEEMNSLQRNETRVLAPLPSGRKAIDCR